MNRSTIADIARKAMVSTATVDRALNRRAGVSAANRQRVIQAAKDLGYFPSDGMMALPARAAHLEFFIPHVGNGFMHDLVAGITAFAGALPLVASCKVTPLDGIGPESLLPALEKVDLQTGGVGIVTTDHPRTRHAIRTLNDAGVRVVTIASDLPSTSRAAYVGVDNLVAGRTAALLMGRMAGAARGSVGLFVGSRAFHGHRERELGFRSLMEEAFPALKILPVVETGEDSARSQQAMLRLRRSVGDLVGIYCVGAGRAGIVEALRSSRSPQRPFVIMHDLTEGTRLWLAEDIIDVVIDQNARLVGEQAVIRLLGSIAANAPLLLQKFVEPRIILRENIPNL